MPRKVSQLELKNRKDLNNNHQVVVTDPTDYSLYRVSVPQFRGASNFNSANEPTTTPEDPSMIAYIEGDTFTHYTPEGIVQYPWDSTNSVWGEPTKLNGLRVLTASDFPDEVQLDLRETNFLTDLAFANDYYLNKTISILFTYSAVNGFRFGTNTFEGYDGFRAPTTHVMQGVDLNGYEAVTDYVAAYVAGTSGTLTPEEQRTYRLPIHNDTYHLLLENDQGHGGWVWYFKSDRAVAAGNTSDWQLALNDKLGIDLAGDVTATRYHFREEKTWNEVSAPVQNDKKYRQGDNVFVTTQGVLYYNYQEGLPDNTTDLGLLFEGQTILAGSSLKTAQDGLGNWITPSANDSEYQEGDYILTRNLGTPRIHGPYSFGAASDLEAWPLYAVLRSPIGHKFEFNAGEPSGFNLPTSFLSDYPSHTTDLVEYMIVDGDKALLDYSNDKSYTLKDSVVVDITNQTLVWGDALKRINPRGAKIHTSAATGEPSVDVTIYADGDIVRNKNGDLYQFNEDYSIYANSTLNLLDGLRANVTHISETTDTNFIPDTAQNSVQWGGSTVQDSDILEVRWTGSVNEKVVLYSADVNEATGDINWLHRRSKHGNRIFYSTSFTQPLNDNTEYTTGDYIHDASGRKYIYDENLNTNLGDWTFTNWDRPPETFITESGNNYLPLVDADDFLQFGTEVGVTSKRLRQGDRILINVVDSGVATGKQYAYEVVTDNPVTFAAKKNTNPTRIFSEASPLRNNKNDLKYSEGDFLDNPSTGWRYGPYVESSFDNTGAWPDFRDLTGSSTISLNFSPDEAYEAGDSIIYEGSVYSANSAMDGSTTPLSFVEGLAAGEWTLVVQGADDIRATDSFSRYYFEVTGEELYFKQK